MTPRYCKWRECGREIPRYYEGRRVRATREFCPDNGDRCKNAYHHEQERLLSVYEAQRRDLIVSLLYRLGDEERGVQFGTRAPESVLGQATRSDVDPLEDVDREVLAVFYEQARPA